MKPLTPLFVANGRAFRLVSLLFLSLGAFWRLSGAEAVGSITGQVVNQATGAPLQGASIVLSGNSRLSTLTEEDGTFRLLNVPAGEQGLVVDYTGLDTVRVAVHVPPGGSTQLKVELTSGVYRMSEFAVSAVREGQAAAINQQRMAPNVENVVSTDAFGNVADTNVGNLLAKLPGISPERDEGDIYRIAIRGMNPDLNSVSVDGTLLAGATTRGNNRAFEVDKVSTNSIESIEVIKSPTPDMDADSIGGKVNLRTKSAFDRKGRDIQYSAAANVYVKRGRSHPSASVSYSDILGADRRLGVALSASFNRTFSPRSAFRTSYLNPTLTAPAAISDAQTAEDDILLDRIGLGGKFNFKLSDTTTLFLNTMYNNFEDNMRQHKQRVRNATVREIVNDSFTQALNGQFTYEMEKRKRTVKTGMVQIGGKTTWRDYQLDYDASHSRSHGTDLRENLELLIRGVNYRVDRASSLHFPAFTLYGTDISNYDNGTGDAVVRNDYHAWDRVSAGQFNLKRTFATALPTYLKSGLRYRGQEKWQNRSQRRWQYVGPDGVAGRNAATGTNDDNLNRFRDDGHRYSPVDGRYPRPMWPNYDAIHVEVKEHPELFRYIADTSLENSLKDNNRAGEDIYAAYVMGNIKIGRLSALAGVRMERTETTGTGPVQDRSKPILGGRWDQTQTVEGSYTNTFPGVHLRYELTPRLLLRASGSTSIGRPSFGALVPGTDINMSSNLIVMNNPSLKPQFSDNYDLSVEYYSRATGMLSVTAFRKNITDFAFNTESIIGNGPDNGFEGLYGGYTLRTRTNGGWARVNGLEFNYQQQFTFLPGVFNGFGVYANATVLSTKGTYDSTLVLTEIQGFVKRTGNVGLSYIKHGFTIRTSLNYVGEGMVAFNNNPALREYQEPRSTVDFSVKYAFRPRLHVFADATNIFNSKYIRYMAFGYRPTNTQIYGARLTTGISGSF